MTAVVFELPRRDQAPSPEPRLVRAWRAVTDFFQSERDRYVLWLPFFLGVGIGIYFLLPVEPPLVFGIAIGAILIACCIAVRADMRGYVLAPVIATVIGFVAGEVRTAIVEAPVLAHDMYAQVSGTVRWLEPLDDGRLRLLIDVATVEGLTPAQTPRRVRISLRYTGEWPSIGDYVEAAASLTPPSGPVAPGAYDYARIAWFDQIGAVGYGGNTLRIVTKSAKIGQGVEHWFTGLRTNIEARIYRVLPQREAAIATALIVGARGGISDSDNQAMQGAGVSHVLSISGLHLALIAGLVFLIVRGGLALIEPIALRWPIKKIAAVIALVAAAFYVGISDGSAPIIRSFLMFGVAMLALLIDRPAISLRTVAFAAAMLLIVSPESLLDPSFQMSFGAVVALIAAYEWYGARKRTQNSPRIPWLARSILATAATSLIAELATAPFAAYHFNQFQAYGLIANEIVVPLLGFFIMPAGALAVIAMPFGLEEWPLKAMGFGIDQMLAIAHWTAELPGSVTFVTAWPATALVALVIGGLWLCLWRRSWRLAGLAVCAAGLALGLLEPSPDTFVGEEGDTLAFRTRVDGEWQYGLIGVRADSYRGEAWLKRLGANPADELRGSGFVYCDALGCSVTVGNGVPLSLVRDGRGFDEECGTAAVLVSSLRAPKTCNAPELLLDWPKLRDGGAAIRVSNGVAANLASKADRPWRRRWTPRTPSPN